MCAARYGGLSHGASGMEEGESQKAPRIGLGPPLGLMLTRDCLFVCVVLQTDGQAVAVKVVPKHALHSSEVS